jgi:hypothetical protein
VGLAKADTEAIPVDHFGWRLPARGTTEREHIRPLPRNRHPAIAVLPRFRQMIAEAGREYDTVPMSVISAVPDAELLKGYAGAGIDPVLIIQTAGRDEVLRKLDEYSKLMHDVAS